MYWNEFPFLNKLLCIIIIMTCGIRFHIHSDSIPSPLAQNTEIQKFFCQQYQNTTRPNIGYLNNCFFLRKPFHDFAEGLHWCDNNEYKLYSQQIYKMKMNFMGSHTYPVHEPLVWNGIKTQFNKDNGNVNTSYFSSWMTTSSWFGKSNSNSGGDWGGIAMNTTNYVARSSMLYPSDCCSNDIQQSSTMNLCPFGNELETENQVFNNDGPCIFNEATVDLHKDTPPENDDDDFDFDPSAETISFVLVTETNLTLGERCKVIEMAKISNNDYQFKFLSNLDKVNSIARNRHHEEPTKIISKQSKKRETTKKTKAS